jgi:hypothetical protein
MHVAKVVSRQQGREYTSWLLRQSYREGGKVKHHTLANLSALPLSAIDAIRAVLRGETVTAASEVIIERSLPHGNVLAVLGTLRRLGLEQLIDRMPSRPRDLVTGMIVARVLDASSKLATNRTWEQSTLASTLRVDGAGVDEMYAALDWLLTRQAHIEKALARRHLRDRNLVLYDLSSSYVEGRHCPLAKLGYSRDGKRGTLQIEYGLLTDHEGRPVAVEVFAGNTGDPATVPAQVDKLRQQFGLQHVVLVGDRGMLTAARIDAIRKLGGLQWISSLRSPQIRSLLDSGALQLGLFDERSLAEISHPDFPEERLVVCRNPALAAERARKREDLLRATEALLAPVVTAVTDGRLRDAGAIGVRVGRVLDKHKVGKHFEVSIDEGRITVQRREQQISAEAALDGIYVLRTSVSAEQLDSVAVVHAYKSLANVERAFRTLKSVDLQIRPLYHWSEDRVRAHVLLCMLAYYVQWHMERAWAPLLFRDEQPAPPENPVAPAQRSAAARRKAQTQQLDDGTAVHSFSTLLSELATLTRNRMRLPDRDAAFDALASPTPLQRRALELLQVSPTAL